MLIFKSNRGTGWAKVALTASTFGIIAMMAATSFAGPPLSEATKEKLKHRILLDGSETAERYGQGSNVPVVLWIDRAGVVVDTEWGFGGAATLERKTKKLLAGAK